ncbi:MAG: tripartite tricarboxylate transporter TctB family protein [Pseudomonadota bacterium]|nr:tripartite tricarboxylate transporter TctB family protein [Pseudomonadota bacterium]
MKTYSRNQLFSLLLLIFSLLLFFFITPMAVEKGGIEAAQDPSFVPNLITIILGLLSFLMLLAETFKSQLIPSGKMAPLFSLRLFIAISFFILYMISTSLIGYIPATFLALAIYLFFFGVRNWTTIIVLSTSFAVFLYWFFAKIMFVMLPVGTIFKG